MAEVFESLGIHGMPKKEEYLLLASLVTGDPILMISEHGAAKTSSAWAMATALELNFAAYDASKSMFEDMIGMPSPKAMNEGKMEYIQSPTTIHDKEFILVDEVNRAAPELQSKWLEILRSRTVMGNPSKVKFIWGAMNPVGYEGTQVMDDAYVGRFALFVYIPHVLDMDDDARVKVINNIGMDDSPAQGHWLDGFTKKSRSTEELEKAGVKIKILLTAAQEQYALLTESQTLKPISVFISKFAKSIHARTVSSEKEKDIGVIKLDGRRLGMIYRSIMAVRAVEIAHANIYQSNLRSFPDSARDTMLSCIPSGVNAEGGTNEAAIAHIGNTFDQLKDFFEDKSDIERLELTYELMISNDILRKAEILMNEDVGELARNSAWTKILESRSLDISVMCLLALNLETDHPGLLPANVMSQMTQHIDSSLISPKLPPINGTFCRFYEQLQEFIDSHDLTIEKLLVCRAITERLGISGARGDTETMKNIKMDCKNSISQLRNIIRRQTDDSNQSQEVLSE